MVSLFNILVSFKWQNKNILHKYVGNLFLSDFIAIFRDPRESFWSLGYLQLGLVARNPVFGVSDKASFKPVSSATETS